MQADNWNVIFADVEGCSTEEQFLRKLCHEIEKTNGLGTKFFTHIKEKFGQAMGRSNSPTWQEALLKTDWHSFLDTLVEALSQREHPTLIMLDEISLYISARLRSSEQTAIDFLHHLRALRQRYPKVRWLLTGSVGLDVVARRATLSGALLGLTPFPLEPFTAEEAKAYLNYRIKTGLVLRSFALDEESFDYFHAELGWLSPYYIDHIADAVRPSGPVAITGRALATRDDIDRAYEALLAPAMRQHFAAFDEHITKNFGTQDQNRLRAILNLCAIAADGEMFTTLHASLTASNPGLSAREMSGLMDILTSDGYLLHDGDPKRCRFRSGLLRRYWLKYQVD